MFTPKDQIHIFVVMSVHECSYASKHLTVASEKAHVSKRSWNHSSSLEIITYFIMCSGDFVLPKIWDFSDKNAAYK